MKVIIAGSRTISDYNIIKSAVEQSNWKNKITLIISGGARGTDQLGEKFAQEHKINMARFPANWKKYGKVAGYIRNKQMAEYGDALIACWDGKSSGTKDMLTQMCTLDKPVHIYKTSD